MRLQSVAGTCVLWELLIPPPAPSTPSPLRSFLDSRKGRGDRAGICNADRVWEKGKQEPGINGPVSIR